MWTGTDTQYKINNLRKIFAIFDVPESELVFYLKDEDNSETVAGNRYEIRKKYWEYTLPQLKNAFSENGLFGNVNPVTSNWIAGFVGIPGILSTVLQTSMNPVSNSIWAWHQKRKTRNYLVSYLPGKIILRKL